MEALLCGKLEELESELHLFENHPELRFTHADSFRCKLSFLKSLRAAEACCGAADADADYLSRIAARISALDAAFAAAEFPDEASIENTKPEVSMRYIVPRENLEELDSMQNIVPLDPAAAKIRNKIDFTKSLLANERPSCGESKHIFAMATLLAVFVAALNDAMPSSCSCTSACRAEEEEEKDVVATGLAMLKRMTEKPEEDINVDGFGDTFRKFAFLISLLVAEMAGHGDSKVALDIIAKRLWSIVCEFMERNWFAVGGCDGGVNGGNESSPCSCTSFCFDGGEARENGVEDGNSASSGGKGTGDLSSLVTRKEVVDCKSGTGVPREGSVGLVGLEKRGGDHRRGFRILRAVAAVVGVFAVAASTAAVVSFFVAGEPFYHAPT